MAKPTASLDFDGSTDWLSMSDANFGAVSNQIIVLIASIRPDVVTSFRAIIGQTNNANSNTSYNLYLDTTRVGLTIGSGGTELLYSTNTGVIQASIWSAIMVVIDLTQGTNSARVRCWVNGIEYIFTTYPTAPNTMDDVSEDVCIGAIEGGFKFDGLICQPTLISGSIPSLSDVFDGNGGDLKDLSGLTGVKFCHQASSATADAVHGTAWTNNGTVTASSTIPDVTKPSRRNSATATFQSSSPSLTHPSGIGVGARLQLTINYDGTSITATDPSGWTRDTSLSAASGDHTMITWRKTAAGTESGTTVSVSLSGIAEGVMNMIAVADTSGVDTSGADLTTGNRTSATIPDLTVANAGSYSLITCGRGASTGTVNTPTNYTSVSNSSFADGTDGAGHNVRDRFNTPDGATGTIGMTCSTSIEFYVTHTIYAPNLASSGNPHYYYAQQ